MLFANRSCNSDHDDFLITFSCCCICSLYVHNPSCDCYTTIYIIQYPDDSSSSPSGGDANFFIGFCLLLQNTTEMSPLRLEVSLLYFHRVTGKKTLRDWDLVTRNLVSGQEIKSSKRKKINHGKITIKSYRTVNWQ